MLFHGKLYHDHRNAFSITKAIHNDVKSVLDMVCADRAKKTTDLRKNFCNNMEHRSFLSCYKNNFYKKLDGMFAIGLQTGHSHSISNDMLYLNQLWVNNVVTAGVYLVPSEEVRDSRGWDKSIVSLEKCQKLLTDCAGSVLVPVLCLEF